MASKEAGKDQDKSSCPDNISANTEPTGNNTRRFKHSEVTIDARLTNDPEIEVRTKLVGY